MLQQQQLLVEFEVEGNLEDIFGISSGYLQVILGISWGCLWDILGTIADVNRAK